MTAHIRHTNEMKFAATALEVAYYTAREHLRECGTNWLDYGISHTLEERYNLALAGEKAALELADGFAKLKDLAEREEA